MPDCLFCDIAAKKIKADVIFEDEKVIAFYDVSPQAPVHFLVIPKMHIGSVLEVDESNSNLIAHIFEVIADLAKTLNLEEGFRVVANTGEFGGQTINHLHFHVLGKRQFSWPPG
ncbi:MAG: histidine triad nucleotide-binding protein [Oscillospiraceae bacterium]|nr:histidine triad nucleotide-binding protein [Oscillospiraceae bacterium]